MTATADLTPYGSQVPNWFIRATLAITRRLRPTRLGLRLSMPLRRVAINSLRGRPVDTIIWNARVRLYPDRNSCEKNALFTPDVRCGGVAGAGRGHGPAHCIRSNVYVHRYWRQC